MPLQHMLDDGQSKPGTTGGTAASRIDAIEALGQAGNMFGGNANAGIGHFEVTAVVISPPARRD